ncbi:MAG: sigma-70 family RNA polymerase sigma factor [Pyrinomonadaceae bacterium]
MDKLPDRQVTQLLASWQAGDRDALDELWPVVYDELRRIARRYLREERPGHTLQPTALVHEAYMRLVGQHSVEWQNRAQFFGLAAQMMRRILVNHAEAKHAQKRGGHDRKITLDAALDFFAQRDLDLVALDEALRRLETLDSQQARLVELKFFSGLSIEEIAEVLGVSPATVKREWTLAKTWLYRELTRR